MPTAGAVVAALVGAALVAGPAAAEPAVEPAPSSEVALAVTATLPIELEAEDAVLAGGAGVNDNHLGFSGTGFVDGFVIDHTGTASVTFTLDVPEAGEYGLNLRYANGLGSDMTLSQVVVHDGATEDRQVTLPSAVGASWSTWFVHQEVVSLDAGEQTVVYRFDADDTGNVNLDAVALTTVGDLSTPGGGATEPGTEPGSGPDTRYDDVADVLRTTAPRAGQQYEAEGAFTANGATVGTEGVDLAAPRARVVVAVDAARAGDQTVTFRYRNTTGADQDAVLAVDGQPVGRLVLAPRERWGDVAVTLPLRAGLGSVELRRTVADPAHPDGTTGPAGGADQGDAQGQGAPAPSGLEIDRVTLQRGQAFADRGASTPATTYEAEHGRTTGEVLAPSRELRTVAAEASGRQAVTLDRTGEHVEWTLTEPANALVLRASVPDSTDGTGQDGSLGVYAGGRKVADVDVTSRYSHVYGGYPYGNDPAQGGAQRFFDETRVLLPRELKAGTTLRLQRDSASVDLPYTVDLLETEVAPAPLTAPPGLVDVRDHGATDDSSTATPTDDTAAFVAAVAAAREAGTGVWVPPGRFTLTERVRVHDVTVRGAGPWYSVVAGRDGKGGFYAQGSGVTIADLMVDGDVRYRDDARFDAALEGSFGQGSLVQNVWISHTKVGLWADTGTDGLYALGLRVRDTFADGVHLHGRVTDTRAEHATVRNTGDDAMAMWSSGGAVTRSSFVRNTVTSPLLGNGAAIYGGDSNSVSGLVVRDTLTAAAGVAVSTRFNPVPFSGTTVVEDSTLIRTGGWEPNWSTSFGGIWVFADTSHITTPVVIRGTEILDSTYEGLLVSGSHWVNDLRVSDTTIERTGSYGVAVRLGGDHRFSDVRVSGVTSQPDGDHHLWGTVHDEGGNYGLLEDAPATCSVEAGTLAVGGATLTTVRVTSTGTEPLDGWELVWYARPGDVATAGVGATVAQDGTRVTASGRTTLRPGRSTTFVVLGTTHDPGLGVAPAFDAATLDGLACAVSRP
ncbi:CBM35 domain-containing protein [Cellulosimicrobium cellulans]|uniref:CBM35 domain-containing protein n=1 Tax=Cellulosimicrobium cellulans TaxID=1710 RepID=UPI0009E8AD7D|nr:CBM35 domain-containing protein [Cellulosimicrobium cellulans]